jgi:hypothetical protein
MWQESFKPRKGRDMPTSVFTRRAFIAAGCAIAGGGASGLIVPARAAGLEPTRTMRGGANNYLPDAPIVDRIGGGTCTGWSAHFWW